MPKSLFIDPNEVLRPTEHQIVFPKVPVMEYKKSVKDDSAESTNENVNDDNDDDTDVSIVDSGTADSAVKDYSNILIVIIICAAVVISVAVISITIYFLKTKDKLQKY